MERIEHGSGAVEPALMHGDFGRFGLYEKFSDQQPQTGLVYSKIIN